MRPFLPRVHISEEVSFSDFTVARIKEIRNVERYILRFETYEWHLKKVSLETGAVFFTAEIEFLVKDKAVSLTQACHVFGKVLARCQHILLVFEVRHLLNFLLGTMVEPGAEIARFAPKRPLNLTRSIINSISSSIDSWLVAPKHDGLYTLLLCYQNITILINDSTTQIFFDGQPIMLTDLLRYNFNTKKLWYIFEGEFIDSGIHLFDILWVDKLLAQPFITRQKWLRNNL